MACNVLIVDDSKLARLSVGRLLSKLRPNWTLTEALDANDALQAISSSRPDIVLVDYNMPGRDGIALVAELRTLAPGMPIAILTANTQTEIIAQARALGAAFLPKPLTETALAEFLAEAEARL